MTRILVILFLSTSYFNSIAQVNLQNGLVACYAFSGNAYDGSGNNYNGTVNGAVLTQDRFGNANSAYQFNGSNSFISIPSAPIVANRNFTVSAWAYLPVAPSFNSSETVFSVGNTSDPYHHGITLTNNYGGAAFTGWTMGGFNESGATAITTNFLPSINTWYHLVLTRDDSGEIMYINGVNSGTGTNGGSPPYYYQNSAAVALIGLRASDIQPFNGVIDDITIYNRALTPPEVLSLFQNGLGCSVAVPITPPPAANNVSLCGKGSVKLTATGGTLYRWYDALTGGNLLYQGNPFITPELQTTTSYFVANVVTGVESARVKIVVTIFPNPVLTCTFPSYGLTQDSLSFSTSVNSGSSPFSYSFDFGDDTKLAASPIGQTGVGVLHAYSKDGNFIAQATVTDINGCQASCSQNITIQIEPLPVVNDASLCEKGSVKLTATGGTLYRWYDALTGGNLLYQGNPFITPELQTTTSYFVANVVTGIESARVKVVVTIFPNPVLTCTFPSYGLTQDSLSFSTSVNSGFPPFGYTFDFGDGTKLITNQVDQTSVGVLHGYIQDGDFTAHLTVTDINGCQASCTQNIPIRIEIFIPNVITADNDNLNRIFTVFTVNSRKKYIIYNGKQLFTMTILNRWGREIFTTTSPTQGWDGSDVDSGTYYYSIKLGSYNYRGWVSVIR